MPLFPKSPRRGCVPVFNSACPWASSAEDLASLYRSPYTSAVTTRTTTLNGFDDDQAKHQMAFFGPDAQSSTNSFGYSPYPLEQYLDWLRPLATSAGPKKQLIVSITGTLDETRTMLVRLQAFADEIEQDVAVEFNASCPNFKGHPPPAYVESELTAYITLLAAHASPTLLPGLKLPPYTYETQFELVVRALSAASPPSGGSHPIAFLTATNTLGQGLVFADQIADVPASAVAQKRKPNEVTALPGGGIGGLAGAHIHNLSLGNVFRLRGLMDASADQALASISIIGVGGVADAKGVERMRKAGASAVACASALGREGVAVFEKLAGKPVAKL